jgi:hypothetical protein
VDKRAVIAKRVDDLGHHFRLAMRTGWLAYIKKIYSAEAVQHGPAADLRLDRENWSLKMMSDCFLVLACFEY